MENLRLEQLDRLVLLFSSVKIGKDENHLKSLENGFDLFIRRNSFKVNNLNTRISYCTSNLKENIIKQVLIDTLNFFLRDPTNIYFDINFWNDEISEDRLTRSHTLTKEEIDYVCSIVYDKSKIFWGKFEKSLSKLNLTEEELNIIKWNN